MCDAILNVSEGTGVYECEYCGTMQTVVIDSNDAAVFGSSHNKRKQSHEENEPVSAEPLLRRAFLFLEDGDWEQAKQYCEKALDRDPENGRAYLGKLMADVQVRREADLAEIAVDYRNNNNFKRALHFGDSQLINNLKAYSMKAAYKAKNEQERKIAEEKYSSIYPWVLSIPMYSFIFAIVSILNDSYILNYLL